MALLSQVLPKVTVSTAPQCSPHQWRRNTLSLDMVPHEGRAPLKSSQGACAQDPPASPQHASSRHEHTWKSIWASTLKLLFSSRGATVTQRPLTSSLSERMLRRIHNTLSGVRGPELTFRMQGSSLVKKACLLRSDVTCDESHSCVIPM